MNAAPLFLSGRDHGMHSGTLINELIALVERTQTFAKPPQINLAESQIACPDTQAEVFHGIGESSESEQFTQPFGLSPADRDLGLLLVVHAQLVGALEPGNNFADAVDVHQIGAMRPPKKIRV